MAYLHPSEERSGTSQGIESDQSDTEERAADPNIATTSQAQPMIHPPLPQELMRNFGQRTFLEIFTGPDLQK